MQPIAWRPSVFIMLINYYKSFSCSQFSQKRFEFILDHTTDLISFSLCSIVPVHCGTSNFKLHFTLFSVHNQFTTTNWRSTTCCKAKQIFLVYMNGMHLPASIFTWKHLKWFQLFLSILRCQFHSTRYWLLWICRHDAFGWWDGIISCYC